MLIDTEKGLVECILQIIVDVNFTKDNIISYETEKLLFCDVEGVRMSRTGEICVMQIATTKHTFIIDVISIGNKTFEIATETGISIKYLLESDRVGKIFFDPRNDSDSLFHQFGIKMESVICLQLLFIGSKRMQGNSVNYNIGFMKLLQITEGIDNEFVEKKIMGRNSFAENENIWRERPLSDILLQYCAIDVEAMIPLYKIYMKLLESNYWKNIIIKHSKIRVDTYKLNEYNVSDPKNRIAPKF